MEIRTMKKNDYHSQFGVLNTGRVNPEAIALFEKLRKLPIDEYLIVEPAKGEKAAKLRGGLQVSICNLAKKFNANFKPRFALNRTEDHVVVYKEAKS